MKHHKKHLKSLVMEAAAVTHRLIAVRSSIPVLILAILGCGSSQLFSQQGHDSVPSAAISEPVVQKAAVGKHFESDLSNTAYVAYLKALLSQLQHDLNSKDINFVLGRISDSGLDNPKKPGLVQALRKAQVEFAESYPRCVWVDTDDLNDQEKDGTFLNDLHYTPEGYRILGERFADKAVALVTGKIKAP